MKIHEKVKKCVAFIQYKTTNGTFNNAGTVFFVARDNQKTQAKYAVTAKHVVIALKRLGYEYLYLKVNLQESAAVLETKINDWIFHDADDVDIAIHPLGLPDEVDHLFFPESAFLDDTKIKEQGVDCGDEVFITGLFKHHHGKNKNLPIVRIGNIAMMPGERIQTKEHLLEAYLIESRSIGGLSGSPVFIHYGLVREIEGQIKFKQGEHIPHLLGIVYGHFDTKDKDIDSINGASESQNVNVGISIVTPINKLKEMFSFDSVKNHELELEKKITIISHKAY